MARLKVNTITDRNNIGPPLLTYGASFPPGSQLNIQGNVNISATGISTVGALSATSINASGIVTATSFVGNGSGLTGLPSVSASKSIALKVILDPLPFRS
jgi:hypothetical protein